MCGLSQPTLFGRHSRRGSSDPVFAPLFRLLPRQQLACEIIAGDGGCYCLLLPTQLVPSGEGVEVEDDALRDELPIGLELGRCGTARLQAQAATTAGLSARAHVPAVAPSCHGSWSGRTFLVWRRRMRCCHLPMATWYCRSRKNSTSTRCLTLLTGRLRVESSAHI